MSDGCQNYDKGQMPPRRTEALASGSSSATGSVFDMRRCPKCGGTTGFTYKLTIQGEQFQPWDRGNGEAHFEGGKTIHGAKRCADCGKTIRPNNQAHTRRDQL